MLPRFLLACLAPFLLMACPSKTTTDSTTESGTLQDDGDGDGYASTEDCDDGDPAVFPGATEICNGQDDNCDNVVDEGVTTLFYPDQDNDGYGDPTSSQMACDAPTGMTADNTDCDDTDPGRSPGAAETCDAVDNDCDGSVDEDLESLTWYTDADNDGWGDATTAVETCTPPAGAVQDGTDCDDGDALVNPGAAESCNGYDDDCDGETDEAGALGELTFYADLDRDGWGDAGAPVTSCTPTADVVLDNTDCNDGDALVNPGATEVCDDGDTDEDCDGAADGMDPSTDVASRTTWYRDTDGDGYAGSTATLLACEATVGWYDEALDCDDGDAAIHPGADEGCDGLDNDCDGVVDGGASGSGTTYYRDGDGDGYGDASSPYVSCTAPDGYTRDSTDCDDTSSAINPGATEVCNGWDDNCDGNTDGRYAVDTTIWYLDDDGDGHGNPDEIRYSCSTPSGYVLVADDCDDANALVWDDCTVDSGTEPISRDGTYTGTGTLDVVVPSLGWEDTCTFDLSLSVSLSAAHDVRGSGNCTFTGDLSLLGTSSAKLDGDITTDPYVEGGVWVGEYFDDDWSGSFPDLDTLEGSFEGTFVYWGFDIEYTGSFTTRR